MTHQERQARVLAYVQARLASLTDDELARRSEVIERIIQLRDSMEPIGIDAAELIDMDFYDIDVRSE
jgi:hypothetical protein